jgi:hypothetical protein
MSIDIPKVRARLIHHLDTVREAMLDVRPELAGIARALDSDPDSGTLARTARLAHRWLDGQGGTLARLRARAADAETIPEDDAGQPAVDRHELDTEPNDPESQAEGEQ